MKAYRDVIILLISRLAFLLMCDQKTFSDPKNYLPLTRSPENETFKIWNRLDFPRTSSNSFFNAFMLEGIYINAWKDVRQASHIRVKSRVVQTINLLLFATLDASSKPGPEIDKVLDLLYGSRLRDSDCVNSTCIVSDAAHQQTLQHVKQEEHVALAFNPRGDNESNYDAPTLDAMGTDDILELFQSVKITDPNDPNVEMSFLIGRRSAMKWTGSSITSRKSNSRIFLGLSSPLGSSPTPNFFHTRRMASAGCSAKNATRVPTPFPGSRS